MLSRAFVSPWNSLVNITIMQVPKAYNLKKATFVFDPVASYASSVRLESTFYRYVQKRLCTLENRGAAAF